MKKESRNYENVGKRIYDNIEIPAELNEVVNRAIASKSKEEVQTMAEKKAT